MKIKKIALGVCAAAISASVLAMTVSAGSTSFEEKAGTTTVRGSLSVSSSRVVATASIADNPANYETAQAKVSIDYTMRDNASGLIQTGFSNGVWGTGGTGRSVTPYDGFSITKATSYNEFNINSITYSGSRYNLTANA